MAEVETPPTNTKKITNSALMHLPPRKQNCFILHSICCSTGPKRTKLQRNKNRNDISTRCQGNCQQNSQQTEFFEDAQQRISNVNRCATINKHQQNNLDKCTITTKNQPQNLQISRQELPCTSRCKHFLRLPQSPPNPKTTKRR